MGRGRSGWGAPFSFAVGVGVQLRPTVQSLAVIAKCCKFARRNKVGAPKCQTLHELLLK
jgi:hypothetical protein